MLLQDPDDKVRLTVIGAVVLLDPSVWENRSWCLGPLKEDFLVESVEGRTDADIRYKNRN